MCLVAIAHRVRPDLPLVLVANRDELHSRPTAPLAWWAEPQLLAGRDLAAGGTWFAVDARGRFAVVTNVRGWPVPDGAPSRGTLVPRFVSATAAPLAFLAEIAAESARYAGFNLIVGDPSGIALLSNADGRGPRALAAGIHVLSNGIPGARWPKVRVAEARLAALLEAAEPSDAELLAALSPRAPAADADLPDTGVGLELERILSSAFIVRPDYGTRSTTALMLRADRTGHVLEQSHDAAGLPVTRRRVALALHA